MHSLELRCVAGCFDRSGKGVGLFASMDTLTSLKWIELVKGRTPLQQGLPTLPVDVLDRVIDDISQPQLIATYVLRVVVEWHFHSSYVVPVACHV